MKKRKILIIIGIFILLTATISLILIKNRNNKKEIRELNISILSNRQEELVFSFSITDFIKCYNSLYRKDNKKDYLMPISEWQNILRENSIHSNYETFYYYFSEDKESDILPRIAAYVPSDSDYVQEISIEFDHHNYTDKGYEEYEKICFYSLKVFFPDLSKEKIIEIYKKLNELAEENIFEQEKGYVNNAIPHTLYHKNGIGVYSYFSIGSSLRLCIIPVTEKTLQSFKDKGVNVYEI